MKSGRVVTGQDPLGKVILLLLNQQVYGLLLLFATVCSVTCYYVLYFWCEVGCYVLYFWGMPVMWSLLHATTQSSDVCCRCSTLLLIIIYAGFLMLYTMLLLICKIWNWVIQRGKSKAHQSNIGFTE